MEERKFDTDGFEKRRIWPLQGGERWYLEGMTAFRTATIGGSYERRSLW